jgi:uncharacterized protein
MRSFLLLLIRVYRRAISPMVGPCCRFEPSCSSYAEEALHTHGLLHATGLILWRLARCQPFGRAGLDPVPRPSLRQASG